MDRSFLDANVLFSAAYRPKAGLPRLWKWRTITRIFSRYALGTSQTMRQQSERCSGKNKPRGVQSKPQ